MIILHAVDFLLQAPASFCMAAYSRPRNMLGPCMDVHVCPRQAKVNACRSSPQPVTEGTWWKKYPSFLAQEWDSSEGGSKRYPRGLNSSCPQ